ncbi:uncharacterized protein mRpS30 [Lepeophtheirus salmonis]|uniref:28S ribosomal protein S30, mitochondriallike [Bombus terrestris] n=1 Tax=Lepeophtheirus salmonis TaxID=72036 RepID=A0A0K2UNI5_LEPSM|nr:uncharacterized protein LOC121123256 [Lepeophtheirus salmonis]
MLRVRNYIASRCFHGVAPPPEESVYSKKPEYPPLPKYPDSMYKTEKDKVICKMRSLDTVEEKAYYLNLPKYYGWFSVNIQEDFVRYGSLKFAKCATASDVVDGENLPVSHSEDSKRITTESLDILKTYINSYRNSTVPPYSVRGDDVEERKDFIKYNQGELSKLNFLSGLDRILSIITNNTSATDLNARLEAFWFKGGFDPDALMVRKRRGDVKSRIKRNILKGTIEDHHDIIYESYDRPMAYIGCPLITKRNPYFLPSFLDMEQCRREFQSYKEAEEFFHDPKSLGYPYKHVHGRNIPCVWTGSKNPCLNISYLSSLNRFKKSTSESSFSEDIAEHMTPNEEALIKSIFHSFAATLSSSTYFGFTPFNNPTYPISTRTAVFDGQSMALSVYQLNRTELHQTQDDEEGRDLRNKLWFSPYRELYTLDSEGSLSHINEDLLQDLISIYLEKGDVSKEHTPYLHPQYKYIHQIKSAYDREYFWKRYLTMNNPSMDNLKRPTIEPWEKIHLIDNPSSMSMLGLRDRQWFRMAKYDFRGREHWDPEFRKLDYYEPPYLPVKFRKTRNPFKRNQYRTRKVTIPVPK